MKTYKKVFGYLGKMKWLIVIGAILSAISTLFTLYGYNNINLMMEKLIIDGDGKDALHKGFVIAIALALGFVVYFLATFLTHIAAFRLESVLRKKGVTGLDKASFMFFDKYSSGKIRKIIDDNAAQTHTAVAHLVTDMAAGMIMPIGIVFLGYLADVKVGIVLTVMVIISFITMYKMMGRQDFLTQYQKHLEDLSAETVEYVRGMQVVKIFGTGIESFTNFYNSIKNYSSFALKYSMSCKWPYTFFQLLFFGVVAFILPIWIFKDNFSDSPSKTAVNLIVIIFLSGVLFVAFMKLMYTGMYVQLADMAMEKLENLYEEMEKSKIESGDVSAFKNFDIEFKNVDFNYDENRVLSNFSIKLKENNVYAFVGASGSGKSTVAKLIGGFLKVDGGEITIGERNILDYSEEALMKRIAFVFQNPKLFKKTIYENVAIGNKDAKREEVMKAISLAGCDDIINKFKEKENTVIGSKGVYLSGGEKQRITIARAILKDADIVILDEASGAVDPENEYEFQKAFSNLMKDKTVIMIAHRLTSIKNADKIFVMENGKIVEEGSHSELMDKNKRYNHYQNLYRKTNDWRVENG